MESMVMGHHFVNGISITHRMDDAWNNPIYQMHDYYEINLPVADGSEKSGFFFEDKMYKITRGTLFLVNDSSLHFNTSFDTPYERYLVCFYPEILRPYHSHQTDLLACFHRTGENVLQLSEQQLQELLERIRRLWMNAVRAPAYGADIERTLLLIEILLYINRLFFVEHAPATVRVSKESILMSPIIEYINTHLGERLSLEHIASMFFLSKSKLCSCFKLATGYTVNDYIISRRILFAKQMLSQNLSIQEICEAVGFNSYTHFIRCFKKITGSPPKRYSRNKEQPPKNK